VLEVIYPKEGKIPVIVCFTFGKNHALFDDLTWGIVKIRPSVFNEDGTISDEVYEAYKKKIFEIALQMQKDVAPKVLILELNVIDNLSTSIVLNGQSYSDPEAWTPVEKNLEYSPSVDYAVHEVSVGTRLIRDLGKPAEGISAIQINFHSRMLTEESNVSGITRAMMYYEETLALGYSFLNLVK
jgi:hypothetical protein